MNDNSEYCVKINVSFEEKQKQLCIDCIHYDSETCTCCYGDQEMINMKFLSQKEVQKLRKNYPAGTAVELIRMDDPQAPAPGTRGIINYVDDVGSIHVSWETGSSLALIPGEDQFKIIQKR